MTIATDLEKFLSNKKVNFVVLEHPMAFTALEIAKAQHIPGRRLIKSVIVKINGVFVLFMLPAIRWIDFSKLKIFFGTENIELATENEVAKLFPMSEIGAHPPFNDNIEVYADRLLEEDETIYFNAGNHTSVVGMKLSDYVNLVHPKFHDFGININS